VSELSFQVTAELDERRPVEVQSLEDDGRAGLPLGEDPVEVDRAGEGARSPGKVDRVVGRVELCPLADEPEGRIPDAGRTDDPFDVRLGEQVVESPRLVTRGNERTPLPVGGEELPVGEGLERPR